MLHGSNSRPSGQTNTVSWKAALAITPHRLRWGYACRPSGKWRRDGARDSGTQSSPRIRSAPAADRRDLQYRSGITARLLWICRDSGHEFVAEVVEADTLSLLGRRVVGEINLACHACEWCARDLGRHCPHRTVLGIVQHPGAFQEFFVLPESNLHFVPDGIPDRQAVFHRTAGGGVRDSRSGGDPRWAGGRGAGRWQAELADRDGAARARLSSAPVRSSCGEVADRSGAGSGDRTGGESAAIAALQLGGRRHRQRRGAARSGRHGVAARHGDSEVDGARDGVDRHRPADRQ
ncbi:MAG: alcohol dehydrogenase catalytic domain-containing protein [Ignavibacteriota bacterium]